LRREPFVKVSIPSPDPVALPPSCRLKHTDVETSTETLKLPLIITISKGPGTALPPQVLAEFQFPDCELVSVTAIAGADDVKIKISIENKSVDVFFISTLRLICLIII
jgi:hypothetical protein